MFQRFVPHLLKTAPTTRAVEKVLQDALMELRHQIFMGILGNQYALDISKLILTLYTVCACLSVCLSSVYLV